MTDPTTKNLVDQHLEEEDFNIYDIIFKYLIYWPWFIISVLVCLAGTYVYLRFQAPVYNISFHIKVDNHSKSPCKFCNFLSILTCFWAI